MRNIPQSLKIYRGLKQSCAQDALGSLRDRMGELGLYYDLSPVQEMLEKEMGED
jgi:hypothetical protein